MEDDEEFCEAHSDAFCRVAERKCLRWWILGRLAYKRWWPVPETDEGSSTPDDLWKLQFDSFLIYMGLLRCRSMFELSYASGDPYIIRCVANWSGETSATVNYAICKALVQDNHWPKSWPEDMSHVAIRQHDWHYRFSSTEQPLPPLHRDGELIDDIEVSWLPIDEQVEIYNSAFESRLAEGPPFDVFPPEIEGISFNGDQWFGKSEHDLRTDCAGEWLYPLGRNTPNDGGDPRNETGPFLLQWLKVIFEIEHDVTLKAHLGKSLKGRGQEWFVETSRLESRGNWQDVLRKHIDKVPKRTQRRIEKFLSLQ